MVLGHSMSTIYSTTRDISTLHGKIVLFTGDRKGTRKCVPIILSSRGAFKWKKCSVIEVKEALIARYDNNLDKYGDLWEPTMTDGTRGELHVPDVSQFSVQYNTYFGRARLRSDARCVQGQTT